MKKIFIYITILFQSILYAQNYPKIDRLESRNFLFQQYQQEVESAEKARVKNKITIPSFYNYIPDKTDTIITLSSRCSLWQETIASLNGFSSSTDSVYGRELVLCTTNGLFISNPPSTSLDYLLYSEYEEYIENGNAIALVINGKNYYFLCGQRMPPSTRLYFLTTDTYLPLEKSVVTSRFGKRKNPITGNWRFHKGIDLAAPAGTKIMSFKRGKIKKIYQDHVLYGKCVIVKHDNDTESLYAHMSKITVSEGQNINGGEKIGEVGTTGQSTGPHLHFELIKNGKEVDPESILK